MLFPLLICRTLHIMAYGVSRPSVVCDIVAPYAETQLFGNIFAPSKMQKKSPEPRNSYESPLQPVTILTTLKMLELDCLPAANCGGSEI